MMTAPPQPSLAAPQTLKILVSHGCDPNRPSHNGTTPLVIATANEHHSVMMHLIVECGVDPVLNDDAGSAGRQLTGGGNGCLRE